MRPRQAPTRRPSSSATTTSIRSSRGGEPLAVELRNETRADVLRQAAHHAGHGLFLALAHAASPGSCEKALEQRGEVEAEMGRGIAAFLHDEHRKPEPRDLAADHLELRRLDGEALEGIVDRDVEARRPAPSVSARNRRCASMPCRAPRQ